MILKTLIGWVLNGLSAGKIPSGAFDKATGFVVLAATKNITSAEKRQWVSDRLTAILPGVMAFLVNLLIELAYSFALSKGLIEKKA